MKTVVIGLLEVTLDALKGRGDRWQQPRLRLQLGAATSAISARRCSADRVRKYLAKLGISWSGLSST